MAYFHTCQTCAVDRSACETRAKLSAALAGLGIGSIKHRCSARVPLYTPGAAVLVQVRAWLSSKSEWDDEPPICWFRGRFIRSAGPQLLVFVAPGTIPEDGGEEWAFEPRSSGFVKAARSRVKPSDWAEPISVDPCGWCANILSLGQPCARDPNYTPPSQCQAAAFTEIARRPAA